MSGSTCWPVAAPWYQFREDTQLRAGEEVLVSAEARWHPHLEDQFRA
jgi:hypothetical protein